MFRFTLAVTLFLIGISQPATAWYKGSVLPSGKSVQNLGAGSFLGQNGVDWFRAGRYSFTNPLDIAALDDDGFIVATLAAGVDFILDSGTASSGATYKWVWEAGIKFKYIVHSTVSSCTNLVNVTVTSGCSGYTATVVASNGLAGSLTFTYGSNTSFTFSATTDGVYEHPVGAKMALYQIAPVNNETRYQNNIYSSPDFDCLFQGKGTGCARTGTGASWVRPMGAVQVGPAGANQEALWRNRIKVNNLSWRQRIPTGAIPVTGGACGAAKICGVNTYTADASADVGGSTWSDGDLVIGVFQSTNTGPSTFAIASRPAVPILNSQGARITAASVFPTNTYVALIYNSTLNAVLYAPASLGEAGAPYSSIPIEARVQYANYFNMNFMDTVPPWATDDYFQHQAAYVCSNLNSWLQYAPAYTNEGWNSGFPQSNWLINMGLAIGFQLGNGSALQYQGLRIRQLWEQAIPYCGAIGSASGRFVPIIEYQIGSLNNNVRDYLFKGTTLVNNFTTQSSVTITVGTPCQVTWTANGWGLTNSKIQISFNATGTLPTGITANQLYYVVNNTNNSGSVPFNLANTENGSPIACSGTASANVAKYVNTQYNASVGQDYSTKPNRPADFAMFANGAPYLGGQNMCNIADAGCGSATYPNNTIPVAAASFWQSAITNWEAGGTGQGAALDAIDYDYRYGRLAGSIQNITCSGTTFTTPLAHGMTSGNWVAYEATGGTMYSGISPLTVYVVTVLSTTTYSIRNLVGGIPSGSALPCGTSGTGTTTVGTVNFNNLLSLSGTWMSFAQLQAANFNGDRPTGYDNLIAGQYEGAFEISPLNSTQCAALSIVATDCVGSSIAMVAAYKNDARLKQLHFDYYNCALGLFANCPMTFGQATNTRYPSSLVLYGSSIWAISPSLTGTPYKSYDGIYQFNTNWLLKRDLDPASNDNDPMWLEKAA